MKARFTARVLFLVTCVVLEAGCVYALKPGGVRGQSFSHEAASRVEKGMGASRVEEVLGRPLVWRDTAAGEVWYYYDAVSSRSCDVYLFGVVPVKRAPAATWDLELILRSGEVASVRYRRRNRLHEPKYAPPN